MEYLCHLTKSAFLFVSLIVSSAALAFNLEFTEPDSSGAYQVIGTGDFDRFYLYERPKGDTSWTALTRSDSGRIDYQAHNTPGEYEYRLLGCNYRWLRWWMTCNQSIYNELLVPDRVFIQVDTAEDFVFLTVNGVERLRWIRSDAWSERRQSGDFSEEGGAPFGVAIDITRYLSKGSNAVKIVAAADSWGSFTGAYDVSVWKNDNDPFVYRDLAISEPVSGSNQFQPLMLNADIQIDIEYGGQTRVVTVTSPQDGEAVYMNGVFSGQYTPASLHLAPGEYTVGLGAYYNAAGDVVSSPDWKVSPPQTSTFYEGKIVLSDADLLVRKLVHLEQKRPKYDKRMKVAIQPYSEMHFGLTDAQANASVSASSENIGILRSGQEEIIRRSVSASLRTMSVMSYSQFNFGSSLLPTKTTPSYRGNSYATLQRGHQVAAPEKYDAILHVFPNINNAGTVVDGTGVAIGEKPSVYIPYTWLDESASSEGLIHELLHLFDEQRVSDFNGADQLHGAEEHGYSSRNHECSNSWQCYYAKYMTSKIVANENTLRHHYQDGNGKWQETVANGGAVPSPSEADAFVGVWLLTQTGFSLNKGPSGTIQNVGTGQCLEMLDDVVASGSIASTSACNSDRHQQWTFKAISGDMYNLMSHDSLRCFDFRDGFRLKQNNICDSALEKRLTIEYHDDRFRIGTVDGRCASVSLAGTMFLTDCDDNDLDQWWNAN